MYVNFPRVPDLFVTIAVTVAVAAFVILIVKDRGIRFSRKNDIAFAVDDIIA